MIKPPIDELKKVLPDNEIIEKIGVGGFKVVYSIQTKTNIEALKVVHIPQNVEENEEDEVDNTNKKRAYREIKILDQCQSPHLVKLGSISPFDVNINGICYIIYSEELIEGDSLEHLIKNEYKPNLCELMQLLKALLTSVKELNSLKVIHRDIKPGNIIRTKDDRVYVLLDLGLAFKREGTNLTQDTRHIPGTIYYIAPEMLERGFRENLDFRADLYNVGLTVYEFASGINPFKKRDDADFNTLYRIKTENPSSLGSLRSDLPEDFCGIIDSLMKKIPALRPANIDNLIRRMEEFK